MALFEDFEGRIPQINKVLKENGFSEGEKVFRKLVNFVLLVDLILMTFVKKHSRFVLKMQNGHTF